MRKWFNELLVGDIIAQPKLKSTLNGLGYFDDQDCDYFQINNIKKGIIYTTNLATKDPMELWCGNAFDEFIKEPVFEIANDVFIAGHPIAVKSIQLSIFEMI